MSRLLLVIALFAAPAALASKPRINLQVQGKKSDKVKAQLKKKLCSAFTCVQAQKGKPAPVDAIVYGEVAGNDLALKVFTDPSSPDASQQFGLAKKGVLAPKQLSQVVAVVSGVVATE